MDLEGFGKGGKGRACLKDERKGEIIGSGRGAEHPIEELEVAARSDV